MLKQFIKITNNCSYKNNVLCQTYIVVYYIKIYSIRRGSITCRLTFFTNLIFKMCIICIDFSRKKKYNNIQYYVQFQIIL